MSSPSKNNDVATVSSKTSGTPEEDTNEQQQTTNQTMQTNHPSIASTSHNNASTQQWNECAATIAFLEHIGLLAMARKNNSSFHHQQQQVFTNSTVTNSSSATTSANHNDHTQHQNLANSTIDHGDAYSNLLSQVSKIYQPNTYQIPPQQQQLQPTASLVPNASSSATEINSSVYSTFLNAIINNPGTTKTPENNTTNIDNPRNSSCKILFLDQDIIELSPYQCLVRKQIEIFEQPPTSCPSDGISQGRVRPVVTGQVGIRCRHCGKSPKASSRAKYSILFPSRLLGLYQAAQNMANTHLIQTCKLIPTEVRRELIQIRSGEKGGKTRKSAYGGGRQYWADGLAVLGVVETDDHRLRFASDSS